MSIYKELFDIQQKLIVSKSQVNAFGNYNYRSCEDILEAVKKVSTLPIVIRDTIELIGDRYYIKASVSIYDEKGEVLTTSGYARECLTKKGMDEAQITGACSSYARKYALNAMFAIDDTKDQDTLDNRHEMAKTEEEKIQEALIEESVKEIKNAIESDDPVSMNQLWHELNRDEQSKVWKLLNTKEKKEARAML